LSLEEFGGRGCSLSAVGLNRLTSASNECLDGHCLMQQGSKSLA